MIYFKLSLVTPVLKSKQFAELNYNLTPLSEFYDQETSYYYNHFKKDIQKIDDDNVKPFSGRKYTFNYTYDEKISLHQNSQKELTFSMLNKINNDGRLEDNPFTNIIHDGSILLLIDNYKNEFLFIVKNIKYEFNENTIVYKVTCQDAFTYQLSTQNSGYTITNDSSSTNFIGAKTIDWWIYRKIVPECHIAYKYLLMPQGLYEDKNGNLIEINSADQIDSAQCKRLIKPPYPNDTINSDGTIITKQFGEYYETISFSCSGSTANAAIISLIEQLDLQIRTFEYYKDTKLYKYFWVEPKKNELRPCLAYSPMSNIQDFNLAHNGDSLSSILNVESNTVADQMISLIPEIPNFFYDYFQSNDWKNSVYYKGMFTSILKNQIKILSTTKPSNYQFQPEVSVHDNIIELSIAGSWNPSLLYPKIKFNNSIIHLQDGDQVYTFLSSTDTWNLVLKINDQLSYVCKADDSKFEYQGQEVQSMILQIPWYTNTNTTTWTIVDYEVEICFYRDNSLEEEEFAQIADECPWLENKLINFDYFTEHNLLSAYENKVLMDKLTNDLRKVNGELLYYTKSYYDALHEKTRLLAELTNDFDSLSASWNSELNAVIENKGSLPDKTNNNNILSNIPYFAEAYKNIFEVVPEKPTAILNREELITDYFNKFFLSEQTFLKNIKAFKEYFESASNVSDIYKTTIQVSFIESNESNNSSWYTFGDINDNAFEVIKDKNNFSSIVYRLQDDKMLRYNYATNEQLIAGQYVVKDEDESGYTLIAAENYKYSSSKKYYKRYLYFNIGIGETDQNKYNEHKTIIISNLSFDVYIEKTSTSTARIVLMPLQPQKEYIEFFANYKTNNTQITLYGQSYFINNFKIGYELVSDNDLLEDWVHRQTQDEFLKVAKNWVTHQIDYELSFKGYLDIDSELTSDKFNEYVKPSFYIKSPIFKQINLDKDGYYFTRVNDKNYSQSEYDEAKQKGYSAGANPRNYTVQTYINYVTANNADQFYIHKKPSAFIQNLYTFGSKLISPVTGLITSRFMKLINFLPYEAFIDGNHYGYGYGYNDVYDGTWFKNYKDSSSIIYAKNTESMQIFTQYYNDKNRNDMKNKCYKQNFYDLFGITYKGLAPIMNRNELKCIPNTWYEPLDTKCIVNTADKILILSIDETIKTKLLEQIKKYNAMDISYEELWNNVLAWQFSSSFEGINILQNNTSINDILKEYTKTEENNIVSTTNFYQVEKDNATTYIAFFRMNSYLTASYKMPVTDTNQKYITSTIYNKYTNKKYDLSTIPNIVKGFMVYNNDNEFYKAATGDILDNQIQYFDKFTHERVYTPEQLLSEKPFNIYKIKANTYSFEEFQSTTAIPVTLIKHTWLDQEKGTFKSEPAIRYSVLRGITEDTDLGLRFTVKSSLLYQVSKMNKGNFWIQYHTDLQHALLFERAASIETELQSLWDTALTASRGCDYFIPDNWRPASESTVNGYSKYLYIQTTQNNQTIYQLSNLIPTVEILKDIQGNTKLPAYSITYKENGIIVNSDDTIEQFLANDVKSLSSINNSVIRNLIVNTLGDNTSHWIVEKTGTRNYYYTNNPFTYSSFFSNIAKVYTNCHFTGNYLMILKRLMNLKYFCNRSTFEYDQTLQRHNQLWDEIYQNFGAVIYERTYSNSNAVSSQELYELASLAFKDYMIPERAYSITVINSHELDYHGEELRVGDPIRIKAEEYYNVYDSLYNSLAQYLFISDISYTLRTPTDFSLTVNNIKYEDKLLSRLISLI